MSKFSICDPQSVIRDQVIMTNLEIALRYMDLYCSGGDPEKLGEVFSEDLTFEGPFYRFDSARDYIASLQSDPPSGCDYRLIRVFESTGSVNLIFEFIKGDIRTPMSQLFEFENSKITRILLIFDTTRFDLTTVN